MKRPSQSTSTFPGLRIVAAIVAAMVAPLCLVPALAVNIAWEDGLLSPWNVAATASIVGSAIFIAAAFRAKTPAAALAFGASASLLVFVNTVTAFTNASHHTSDARDVRAHQIATISRLNEQRSQWSQGRKSAAMVAGETPTATIRAELDRTIAAGARRWASTNHCAPDATTALASIRLCERVAALRGRVAAAERRDALDAKLEGLRREVARVSAPTSADPFIEAAGDVASVLGVTLSGDALRALPAIYNVLRALALELLAALGPSAVLLLLPASGDRRRIEPRTSSVKREAPKPQPVEEMDHFGAFVAACVARQADATVRAGDMWQAWQRWCSDRGIDAGKQKRFGQAMSKRFKHDRNGGRPRYLGASLTPLGLPVNRTKLALVAR